MANIEYITLEDFLNQCGLKEQTIYKNRNKIKGLEYSNGEYKIPEGTRYPFNIGHNKLKTSEKKRYLILKAIGEYRYIDGKMLHMSSNDFEAMVKQLHRSKLICRTNTKNKYGTNMYILESAAEILLKEKKEVVLKILENVTAKAIAVYINIQMGK